MRKHIYLTVLFLMPSFLVWNQDSYLGLFHSDHEGFAVFHADGIFKYFIESDNQLKFGNTEQAVLLLDNAIAENPFFAEAYLKRSSLMARLGRLQEAKRDIQTAQRLNPYLGKLIGKDNDLEKLSLLAFDQNYFKNIQIENVPLATNNLLQSSIEKKLQGDLVNALIELNQVFDEVQNPEAFLYGMRGNIHLILNNYQEAILDYNKAIQLSSDPAIFYYNRGLARLLSYNRSAACADLETSDDLGFERSKEKIKYFCTY